MNVFEVVANLIADRYEIDADSITAETTFQEIGIDSLDTVELLMDLEDEVGCELELEEQITTVGELVAFIEAKKAE